MNTHAFSDREGLVIAQEIERRGELMYRRAARIASDKTAKALLEQLGSEEVVHRGRFASLAKDQSDAPYSVEKSELLSAIASDIVFSDGLRYLAQLDAFNDVRAILEYAIASENESIHFYTELDKLTCSEEAKTVFGEIIREERMHASRLQRLLQEWNEVNSHEHA